MRAFVCHIIPQELVVKHNAPQAPNNFCINLINGGLFQKVNSIVPMSYFDDTIQNTDHISYLVGNENGSKISKLFAWLINNFKCAWNLRKYDSVWFYNLCKAGFLAYFLLRYVFRVKCYVILLDLTPNKNIFSLEHYLPYFYKKSKGIISLSMRTDIKHPNMGYKAGVIPSDKIQEFIPFSKKGKINVLFSGAISNHTGFPLAIEALKNLENIELYVSGNGDVYKYHLEKYNNIHYLGYMDYSEYLKLYDKIDICLSLRDPSFPENSNNFPSKILEYFCYNKVVISTIEYPEIKGFQYIHAKYDKQFIKKSIEKLATLEPDQIDKLRNNQNALRLNFTSESWLNEIIRIEHYDK